MLTRRQMGAAAAFSVAGAPHPIHRDGQLARLVAEHDRFDRAIQAAEEEADAALLADGPSKRREVFEGACARAEALHVAQGRVANAIINLPAASFLGVAYKLIVWRREAAISFPDDFDAAHESFTFSAYRDLLRLTGLEALAHVHDRATLARMRKYWIPS